MYHTCLKKDAISVLSVEHLLATLYAFGIDNVIVDMDGCEIPIGDGSARHFVEKIEKVGVESQKAVKPVLSIK